MMLFICTGGQAQIYECTGFTENYTNGDPSRGTTCTSTSTVYQDFYRYQQSWYPTGNVPIKYINVAFTVIQKTTPGNSGNFDQSNPVHIQYLNDVVAQMNSFLMNNQPPSDPRTNICGGCYYQDSRIRINRVALNFVQNDAAWGTIGSSINAVEPSTTINIYFVGDKLKPDGTCIPGGNALGGFIWMARTLCSSISVSAVAQNVLHEIFHVVGVNHVYANGSCGSSGWNGPEISNTLDIDYLRDVFGFPGPHVWEAYAFNTCDPNSNCNTSSNNNDNCTNNFMGWRGAYISPMQMGRIHRNAMLNQYIKRFFCGYSSTPYLITANELWDFNIKFYQDIVVKAGVTLTIKCQVNMVPGAKIIVEPNARLIIDGGVITNGTSNTCTTQWAGIEVWGNSTQHQYTYGSNQLYQGFVELKNGAIIENAVTAISTIKAGDWQMLNTGGIIQATNAIFRNNKRDIEFLKYQNFNPSIPSQKRGNLSFFRNCSFTTEANLNGGVTPTNHITMWAVDGIRIYGCTFENTNTLATSNAALGNGIYSEDANFIISPCDWNLTCLPSTCCNYAQNTFRNLNFGVWAKKVSGISNNYTIDQTNFVNCVVNVNNEAVDNAIITRNNFTIGKPRFATLWTTGIQFNTGTNFRIEENTITRSASPNSLAIGTFLTNTGMVNNQVYKNTFTNVGYGNLASQRNRGYSLTTGLYDGLAYLCNNHYTLANYDIYINGSDPVNDGIRTYQGVLNTSATGVIASAGNIFTRSGSTSQSDIANTNTPNITYFYDGSPSFSNPKFPFYVTPNRVTRTTAIANACPTNFGSGGSGKNSTFLEINTGKISLSVKEELITKFTEHNQALTQYKVIYQSLMDGGNTNLLKAEVENSSQNETWQLRQKLIGKSPYLSKEVLKESLDKTSVLPDAVLFEILSANPDGLKDEELVKYLSEKINPLPEWMIELLKEGGGQMTSRTILESTITYHKSQRDLIASYLVQDILTHREDGQEMDHQELRSWLATYKSAHGDYQIIDDFFETGDYNSGLSLLSTIPNTYKLSEVELKEFLNMNSLFNVLSTVNLSGRNIFTLSESELSTMKDIAENGEGVARVRACNLISFVSGEECNYNLKLPEDAQSSFKTEKQPSVSKNPLLPSINVFPNPAKDYVQFSYTLIGEGEEGTLTISNVSGVIVHQQKLNSKYGQIAVNTSEWLKGTYSYSLTSNGKTISNQKFIITN